jgi:excisionase family DNA binding protein
MTSQKHAVKCQLVGPESVAARLNVSRNTVLNWARTGKIPCIRIGKTYRFDPATLTEELKLPPYIWN